MEITRLLSKTCRHHIWSSDPELLINVRVLSASMSDHLPTIVTRKYKVVKQNKSEHTRITYRDIKNPNKEQFIAALKEVPCDSGYNFDDPDVVVDAWYDILQGLSPPQRPLCIVGRLLCCGEAGEKEKEIARGTMGRGKREERRFWTKARRAAKSGTNGWI